MHLVRVGIGTENGARVGRGTENGVHVEKKNGIYRVYAWRRGTDNVKINKLTLTIMEWLISIVY